MKEKVDENRSNGTRTRGKGADQGQGPACLACLLALWGLAQHSRRPVFWYGLAMQDAGR